MKIGIIGGGILGMVSGYYLSRIGHEIIILEEKPETGGLAGSFKLTDDVLLERYCLFISPKDSSLLELLDDFDIKKEIVWNSARTGAVRHGDIYPFTNTFDLLRFPYINLIEKLRFAYSISRLQLVRNWLKLDKLSAREWIIRNSGLRVYENIWQHFFESRFPGLVHTIPTSWFWAHSARKAGYRPFFRLKERLGYFPNSINILFDSLRLAIERNGGTILTGTPAKKIVISNGRLKGVKTDTMDIGLDRLLTTVPIPRLKEISPELVDLLPEKIRQLEYACITNVILEMKRPFTNYFSLDLLDSKFPFTNVTELTNLRPADKINGNFFLHIPNYLRESDSLYKLDDDSLVKYYLPFLKMIKKNFTESDVLRYRVYRQKHADPYCFLNYSSVIPSFSTPIRGIYLANTSQIYPWPRSIDSGINYARKIQDIVGK